LTPLFDRVLVQRIKPVTQVGGIVLPESATKKNNEARVIATGKGMRNFEGKFTAPVVQVGDRILLADFRGDDVHFEGEDLILIRTWSCFTTTYQDRRRGYLSKD
jgi:chaperonin GroES